MIVFWLSDLCFISFRVLSYVTTGCVRVESQSANRYRTMERGHTGRKDLSVPRYGRKFSFFLSFVMVWHVLLLLYLYVIYLDQPIYSSN